MSDHADTPLCRSCRSERLSVFLDLGSTPLADRILTVKQLDELEPRWPLQVAFCEECALVQILETVAPELLFCADYPYFSSVSTTLLEHSRLNVKDLIDRRKLTTDSLVIELASNDGYLLQFYRNAGVPVLGIDPAIGPAERARERGIPTEIDFFSADYAQRLVDDGKKADVIHANNVLAHVADTNGFVDGIARLLKHDGIAVIEHPYVRDLIENNQFDTIYHEHLCYFSVLSLDKLFRRHGLYLQDIRRLAIHGGSLRLYVSKQSHPSANVQNLLETELALGMDKLGFYESFGGRVKGVCTALRRLLEDLKARNALIAAYGAAAKGSTLLNVANIGPDLVDFVVDQNVFKQGRFMPGQHLPIYPTGELINRLPDYTLVLAWNFASEIVLQQTEYLDRGGRFIVPIPEPRILG